LRHIAPPLKACLPAIESPQLAGTPRLHAIKCIAGERRGAGLNSCSARLPRGQFRSMRRSGGQLFSGIPKRYSSQREVFPEHLVGAVSKRPPRSAPLTNPVTSVTVPSSAREVGSKAVNSAIPPSARGSALRIGASGGRRMKEEGQS
jgi:hypothetical protein